MSLSIAVLGRVGWKILNGLGSCAFHWSVCNLVNTIFLLYIGPEGLIGGRANRAVEHLLQPAGDTPTTCLTKQTIASNSQSQIKRGTTSTKIYLDCTWVYQDAKGEYIMLTYFTKYVSFCGNGESCYMRFTLSLAKLLVWCRRRRWKDGLAGSERDHPASCFVVSIQ